MKLSGFYGEGRAKVTLTTANVDDIVWDAIDAAGEGDDAIEVTAKEMRTIHAYVIGNLAPGEPRAPFLLEGVHTLFGAPLKYL